MLKHVFRRDIKTRSFQGKIIKIIRGVLTRVINFYNEDTKYTLICKYRVNKNIISLKFNCCKVVRIVHPYSRVLMYSYMHDKSNLKILLNIESIGMPLKFSSAGDAKFHRELVTKPLREKSDGKIARRRTSK